MTVIEPISFFATDIMEVFSDLGITIREINVANGWDGSRKMKAAIAVGKLDSKAKEVVQHQIVELALIVTEASEAIEELRNGHGVNETYYIGDGGSAFSDPDLRPGKISRKPEGVPSEAADIFIRLSDFCDAWDIDLGAAVIEKLNYNSTRGFRHGGKAA